jgi:hypothetical protein
MRKLASLLSILAAITASAGETWRWKDANGVVHYSDRPVPGAVQINVRVTQKSSTDAPAEQPSFNNSNGQTPPSETVGYTRCVITSPTRDQVINVPDAVGVSLELDPALQDGHQVQVFLNGRAYEEWPSGSIYFALSNLYRGTYSLSARVVDAQGKVLCGSQGMTFHVRQPSLLSPGRQPKPRP